MNRHLSIYNLVTRLSAFSGLLIALNHPSVVRGQTPTNTLVVGQAADERIVLPPSVPDRIERFNRMMWGLNRGLMTGVVKPTGKAYRFVVPISMRTGISNFGRNINYPGRLINHLLQGRWKGAQDETHRFFSNTIAGGAGFVDVATMWKIPKSEADFGQTFGRWGWSPRCYLMLPVFGPSNERDLTGFMADTASNPLAYINPYSMSADNPLTFISPYMYAYYAVTYNNLTENVDDYVRFARTEADPYWLIQYGWTFVRKDRAPRFDENDAIDTASMDTLRSVAVSFTDPKFPDRGKTKSVRLPSTDRKLKFTQWMQKTNAPLVYIVPGLGSHRLVGISLALAELAFQNGYSVVCVSSPYHPEFMESASTVAMPAYTPTDVRDLQVALAEIDRRLTKRHRIGARVMMGYSMGGFQSLFVAATMGTNAGPQLRFDRFVAIDPPVRLSHGISKVDELYQAPLAWPAGERTANIENTFLKIATGGQGLLKPQGEIRFNAVESRFLIGLTFRLILRDAIFSSQLRTNQGVLQQPLRKMRRGAAYQEILNYSFADYLQKFVTPYYRDMGMVSSNAEAIVQAGDLTRFTEALKADERVHVIANENDFLLSREDLDWLRANVGAERLKLFARGGHLGNLAEPEVRQAISEALRGL